MRAKNEAGIVDPTPAEFTWTVTGSGGEEEGGGEEEPGGKEGEEKTGTLPPGEVAKVEQAIINASPPAITPSPLPAGCTVPKLKGKTKAEAKAALRGAGCRLGQVIVLKRKAKPPSVLIVVGAPAPGSHDVDGVVGLTVLPTSKPKPKRPHH